MAHNEKDPVSGVETTGHEWDGLKELNNPAPRWWLIVFLLCVLWSVGYWVVYPAWPTLSGNTRGTHGWTEYRKLKKEQGEIIARRGAFSEQVSRRSVEEIQKDPKLYEFAVAGGRTAFRENCAACHGTGAQGGHGYPNLNDDDWLWGGRLADIYTTIKYGIRSSAEETRTSQMPAFGKDGILTKQQIADTAEYVLSLSGKGIATDAGAKLFADNCSACHGTGGTGGRAFGAPNLADAIWLYSGDKDAIMSQITNPKHGIMPTWDGRLPDETIKELAVYVHSLGGGE